MRCFRPTVAWWPTRPTSPFTSVPCKKPSAFRLLAILPCLLLFCFFAHLLQPHSHPCTTVATLARQHFSGRRACEQPPDGRWLAFARHHRHDARVPRRLRWTRVFCGFPRPPRRHWWHHARFFCSFVVKKKKERGSKRRGKATHCNAFRASLTFC